MPPSPDRLALARQTVEAMDPLFFQHGIDKDGRGIMLLELINRMADRGEFTRRQAFELQEIAAHYLAQGYHQI